MKKKEQKEMTSFILRISKEELAEAKTKASDAGISLSELIRAQLADAQIMTRIDTEAMAELRKLGGLCKHLYNKGAPPEDTGAALQALEQAASALANDLYI